MKVVKNTLLMLLLLLLGTKISAQDSNLINKARNYLELNGTLKQYDAAYDQLLALMAKQFPKSDKNSNGWVYLEKNKTKALVEIQDLLVPVYLDHFSEAELGAMSAFYQSDAGKQLVLDQTKLNEDQQKAVMYFFNSDVGEAIKTKQSGLTAEISAVSELWSKDLYQTAVLLLKE